MNMIASTGIRRILSWTRPETGVGPRYGGKGFCLLSAVPFFAMLVPLTLRASHPPGVPAVFAVATALPVIAFSLIMVTGIARVGSVMKAVGRLGYRTRRIVGVTLHRYRGISPRSIAARVSSFLWRSSIFVEPETFIHRRGQQVFNLIEQRR